MNLFILTSQLQIFHAILYARQLKLDPSSCTLFHLQSAKDDENTKAMADAAEFPWLSVVSLPRYEKQKADSYLKKNKATFGEAAISALTESLEYAHRKECLRHLERALDSLPNKVSRIILGDYRAILARQIFQFINPKDVETVLVDDGAVTKEVMDFRFAPSAKKTEVFRAPVMKFNYLTLKDPFCYHDPQKITFYSLYNQDIGERDEIIPNLFYKQRSADVTVLDEVWVFGVSHVETGIAYENEYLKLLTEVGKSHNNIKIVYFPHRRENRKQLYQRISALQAEIRVSSTGFEKSFFINRQAPKVLISFGSTVIDTASKLLTGITDIIILVPPSSYFTGKRKEHALCIIRDNFEANQNVTGITALSGDLLARSTATLGCIEIERENNKTAPLTSLVHQGATVLGMNHVHSAHGLSNEASVLLETEELTEHFIQYNLGDIRSEPRLFAIKIASLGRSQIKICIIYGDNQTGPALEFDLDNPSTVTESHEGVQAILTSVVDNQRIAQVFLILQTLDESIYANNVRFQIKTLDEASNTFHSGNSMLGFGVYPKIEIFHESACLSTLFSRLNGQNKIIQLLLKPSTFYLLAIEVGSKSLAYFLVDSEFAGKLLDHARRYKDLDMHQSVPNYRIIAFKASSSGDCCITDRLCTQICFERQESQLLLSLPGETYSLCGIPQHAETVSIRLYSPLKSIVHEASLVEKPYTCFPGRS